MLSITSELPESLNIFLRCKSHFRNGTHKSKESPFEFTHNENTLQSPLPLTVGVIWSVIFYIQSDSGHTCSKETSLIFFENLKKYLFPVILKLH